MDSTNEKEKNIIDDKWLKDLQDEIKQQRLDLERSKRINIKRERIKELYEEALYGDYGFDPEDVLKYIEDRVNFNDEEEKEAAQIYIKALNKVIERSPKIKIERGNQNDMDDNKIVQALTEAFVPMFQRIDNRLDNIETDMKEVKSRLTKVEIILNKMKY